MSSASKKNMTYSDTLSVIVFGDFLTRILSASSRTLTLPPMSLLPCLATSLLGTRFFASCTRSLLDDSKCWTNASKTDVIMICAIKAAHWTAESQKMLTNIVPVSASLNEATALFFSWSNSILYRLVPTTTK